MNRVGVPKLGMSQKARSQRASGPKLFELSGSVRLGAAPRPGSCFFVSIHFHYLFVMQLSHSQDIVFISLLQSHSGRHPRSRETNVNGSAESRFEYTENGGPLFDSFKTKSWYSRRQAPSVEDKRAEDKADLTPEPERMANEITFTMSWQCPVD